MNQVIGCFSIFRLDSHSWIAPFCCVCLAFVIIIFVVRRMCASVCAAQSIHAYQCNCKFKTERNRKKQQQQQQRTEQMIYQEKATTVLK